MADLGRDGVLLGRSVQFDGGDVILLGDQQRLVSRTAPSWLCAHLGGASSLFLHQGANQVAVLLSGFILTDSNQRGKNTAERPVSIKKLKEEQICELRAQRRSFRKER